MTTKGMAPWNKGKGRGWLDQRGYRWIRVFEDGRYKAKREHRVIMEQHLGRKLEPWEIVHHRDHNPSNNAIENLEVKEFGEHTTYHSTGARKDYNTKKTIEAFALMRGELASERRIKADLLEALKAAMYELESLGYDETGNLYASIVATIKKAEGR